MQDIKDLKKVIEAEDFGLYVDLCGLRIDFLEIQMSILIEELVGCINGLIKRFIVFLNSFRNKCLLLNINLAESGQRIVHCRKL